MTDTIVFNVAAPQIAVQLLDSRADLYNLLIDLEHGILTFPQLGQKPVGEITEYNTDAKAQYEIAFNNEQDMLVVRYDNGPFFSERYTERGFAGKHDFLVYEKQTGRAAIVSGYKTDGIFKASMIPDFLLLNVVSPNI